MSVSGITDSDFLKELDLENLKEYYVKIIVYGPSVQYERKKNEYLNAVNIYGSISDETKNIYNILSQMDNDVKIAEIQGKISAGSISINGNSSIRRTGNITFLAEDEENDLTDLDNLFSINKKIQIFVGLKNNINSKYDDIIWFNQGFFVIAQPSISHTVSGTSISLQLKDKMCLLNGECGGGLPASVTFDSYNQIIGYKSISDLPDDPNNYTVYELEDDDGNSIYYMWDATAGWSSSDEYINNVDDTISIPQRLFDIIQTLVCNYGGEAIAKISINDIDLELKQIVRYTGSDTLYYNPYTQQYTLDKDDTLNNEDVWVEYNYNEDCGYEYTDFVYPGDSLTSGIGENVCSVLDKIKNALGNYEYFYDVNGNFVFQEIKNYINTTYSPVVKKDNMNKITDSEGNVSSVYSPITLDISSAILTDDNYYMDLNRSSKSVYTFEEGSKLITSYSNSPGYSDIKNDFHVWGKVSNGICPHYHIAIKAKPEYSSLDEDGNYQYNIWYVNYEMDNGIYTGKVALDTTSNKMLSINGEIFNYKKAAMDNGIINLGDEDWSVDEENLKACYTKDGYLYTPLDWRAELYMQGLQKKALGIRPDIYEQELLDNFDSIYDFSKKVYQHKTNKTYLYCDYESVPDNESDYNFIGYGAYKTDIINNPNELNYWIDFIEPTELYDISVDALGARIYSYQQDTIVKMFNADVPNVIIVCGAASSEYQASIVNKCEESGQIYSRVHANVYNNISLGTAGYSAQEVARDLLYQYTNFTSSITINSIPIYYLEPNSRITVYDKATGINGDYLIKTINLPLDAKSTMSISATKIFEKI